MGDSILTVVGGRMVVTKGLEQLEDLNLDGSNLTVNLVCSLQTPVEPL